MQRQRSYSRWPRSLHDGSQLPQAKDGLGRLIFAPGQTSDIERCFCRHLISVLALWVYAGRMSMVVRRNVAELPESSRESLEQLLGKRLEADQRVYIIVESPVQPRIRVNTRSLLNR